MLTRVNTFYFYIFALWSSTAFALTPSNSGSGSNTYLFIENQVDNEYFITSGSLSPRFSGANVWTKYPSNQRSLGYLGNSSWSYSSRYFDLWIKNSPIGKPFIGLRCMTTGSECPSSGYLAPDVIDKEGIYHVMSGSSIENGSYGAGTLSNEAYEYFRSQSVGATDTLDLNLCYMDSRKDYDYSSGKRCKDLSDSGTWKYYTVSLTKVGHLTLENTGAMADIWVASDGSPSVNSGSELCQVGVVGRDTGLICKLIAYKLSQTERVTTSLDFSMIIDTGILGFKPSASDVKYSGDGVTWNNFSSSVTYSKVFTTSGKYVYIFLSNSFFKKELQSGSSIANKESLFTFYFDNSITPQSGYYQFTPSSVINITPKEYGISIVSTNGDPSPTDDGLIGSEKPITFEYKITTSASRQADSIKAQVVGNTVDMNGIKYCLFTSADGKLNVPIPAYLSWVSATEGNMIKRNSCGDSAVDMTNAKWVQTAWNANVDTGYFFTTNLRLVFPMNDNISKHTVDGSDWMGTVNANGELKVTATWVGVDR
ncbi:fimbrial protein [Klebsiella aerogenes]|uniref:fimbrial protein n=1 Tax=Klebsiella aerogenes TaxID=548 RepID=UPI0032DAEEB1